MRQLIGKQPLNGHATSIDGRPLCPELTKTKRYRHFNVHCEGHSVIVFQPGEQLRGRLLRAN